MKRLISTFLASVAFIVPILAATPQQMEQARVAAYRLCLRYMNNGSGYLDDSKFPGSTSELESTIGSHEKEKANLRRLQAIAIPPESEYASWDKGTFDKFWTVTFLDRVPNFDGKSECRGKVAKKVSAIKVTVAEPVKPEEKPAEEPAAQPEQTQEQPEAQPAADVDAIVEAAPAVQPAADSTVIDASQAQVNTETQSHDSGNLVSIIVLVVLVFVVVGLVAYALNVMRKNNQEEQQAAPRRQVRQPQPSAPVSTADVEDESAFASYAAPEPVDTRDREIAELRAEVERLRRRQAERQPEPRYAGATPRPRQNRVIYLAQANPDGVFTRADAAFNNGHSIFKLVTTDGVSGTYQVIDDRGVHDLALSMPEEYLENACTGRNLRNTMGASVIMTEAAGTAIFDRGRWRVTRKAQIRYSR